MEREGHDMSRVIRTAAALVFLLAVAIAIPAGKAGAVEQGTISVHVTWPDGKPSEAVVICFAVTSDAAGTDILSSKCTDSEQNVAVFGPTDPGLATGVPYYVWQAQVAGPKDPNAGAVALVGVPITASIDQNTGNVDVTFAMYQQQPTAVPATEPVVEPTEPTDQQATEPAVAAETPAAQLPATGVGIAASGMPWTGLALAGGAFLLAGSALIVRRRHGAS
jgi:hypothetical protein